MDTNEVEKVYKLANLSLPEEDLETIATKYKKVMNFIERIFEVDTSKVDMLEIVASHNAVLRDDVVKESLSRQEALENAKDKEFGYFRLKWKL